MRVLVFAVTLSFVGAWLVGCSGKSGATAGASASSQAIGSGPASTVAAPVAAPVAAAPVIAPSRPGVPGCGDFEELEKRIGDGLLTADEERCLRGRLAASLVDTDRYRTVHLLTIDLDSNGMAADAMALRVAEMPKIDCAKVEERLRPVCELQKGAVPQQAGGSAGGAQSP